LKAYEIELINSILAHNSDHPTSRIRLPEPPTESWSAVERIIKGLMQEANSSRVKWASHLVTEEKRR
jgi:hypothetical protein